MLQAGFALALILMILMAGICLYSCYLILKTAEDSSKIHLIKVLSNLQLKNEVH